MNPALLDDSFHNSEDEDADNPDERKPQRLMDKMIVCDEELSDSDDEGDKRRDNQIHKVRSTIGPQFPVNIEHSLRLL